MARIILVWTTVCLLGVGGFIKWYGACVERSNLFSTPTGESEVVWITVNVNDDPQQGDAHLLMAREGLTGGPGEVVLIDGGEYVKAKELLLPFLKTYGIEKINSIFITHPHNDHFGGAIALLEAGFPIGEIYWNEPTKDVCASEPWGCDPEAIEDLKTKAIHAEVPLKKLIEFDRGLLGRWGTLTSVFQATGCPVERCSINDTSWVSELRVGKTRALFTGDLDSAVGNWFAKNREGALKSTFLKVPHHGTAGLPGVDFFSKVNPAIAIVPAHHPLWCNEKSQPTREWLLANGDIKTYVNGVHGHIFVHFYRNGDYWVRTQYAEKRKLHCGPMSWADRVAILR
ncbi:MAG: MBL fold metallo-hydrolase [Bdellovibrionia bacterium]